MMSTAHPPHARMYTHTRTWPLPSVHLPATHAFKTTILMLVCLVSQLNGGDHKSVPSAQVTHGSLHAGTGTGTACPILPRCIVIWGCTRLVCTPRWGEWTITTSMATCEVNMMFVHFRMED